jgi:hypothetical protein
MDPNNIEMKSIEKIFEYKKQARDYIIVRIRASINIF